MRDVPRQPSHTHIFKHTVHISPTIVTHIKKGPKRRQGGRQVQQQKAECLCGADNQSLVI